MCQHVASEAENGFLAEVQPLAEVQGGNEGGEVAAQRPATHDAAQLHEFLLARGAARPVLPFELFFAVDRGSRDFERQKIPAGGAHAVEFGHQAGPPDAGHEQDFRGEAVGWQRAPVFLQAQRAEQIKGDPVDAGGGLRGGCFMFHEVAGFRGVDSVFAAVEGKLADGGQFGPAVAGADAAVQGMPPGERDEREFAQGAADEHHVEVMAFSRGQVSRAPASGFDDVGGGRLAEVLQAMGNRRRGKNCRVGAGAVQRAARAFLLPRHAGKFAQRMPERAAQRGTGPFGQVQWRRGAHVEAVAGEGEHGQD
ncbi:MAG: hypothetical protein WBJ68_16610 [Candidatus Dechloromonas phosphoritropha]